MVNVRDIDVFDLETQLIENGWTAAVEIRIATSNGRGIGDFLAEGYFSHQPNRVVQCQTSGFSCYIVSRPVGMFVDSVEFVVTQIDHNHPNTTYEPEFNFDPDSDSDGTSISIERPATIQPTLTPTPEPPTPTPQPTVDPYPINTTFHIRDIDIVEFDTELVDGGWVTSVLVRLETNTSHAIGDSATIEGYYSNEPTQTVSCQMGGYLCALDSSVIPLSEDSVEFFVTNAAHDNPNTTYASEFNYDEEDDSDGNSIVIIQPDPPAYP